MTQTPLRRSTATAASRVMLPFYVLFNLGMGLTWTFQDDQRSSIGIRALEAKGMPSEIVGLVIAAVGLSVLLGMLSGSRFAAAMALMVASIFYAIFAGFILANLDPSLTFTPWPYLELGNARDSLSAFLWPVLVAVASFASFRSLMADEYTDPTGNKVR